MILYGASGHGLVIADTLKLSGVNEIDFWDDKPGKQLEGYRVSLPSSQTEQRVILSIGNNRIRRMIDRRSSYTYGKAIHPKSVISPNAVVEEGTVVMAGAIINTQVRIGRHCIINTGAVVDHEAVLGDFVHISPNATLSGLVQVGEGSWIGAGSVVIQELRIGAWCIVGAGAVVTKDVPDYAVVVGNPARIIRYQSFPEL